MIKAERIARAIWATLNLDSRYTFLEGWGKPSNSPEKILAAMIKTIRKVEEVET